MTFMRPLLNVFKSNKTFIMPIIHADTFYKPLIYKMKVFFAACHNNCFLLLLDLLIMFKFL